MSKHHKNRTRDIGSLNTNEWLIVMSGLLSIVFALGSLMGLMYMIALLGIFFGGTSLVLAVKHKHFDHTYLGFAGVIISLTAIWVLSSSEIGLSGIY